MESNSLQTFKPKSWQPGSFFCYCSTFPGYCYPWGFTFFLSISNSNFLFFTPFKPILLKTEMTFSTNLRGWLNKINLPTYSYFTKEGRSTEHLNFQYHPPAPIRTPYYLSIHSNCYKEAKKKCQLCILCTQRSQHVVVSQYFVLHDCQATSIIALCSDLYY